MKKQSEDYALCSLCLVRRLHINPKEAINDLLVNAVDNYSKKVKIDLEIVLNSIIYDYHNNGLNHDLQNRLNDLSKLKLYNPDKYFRGFMTDQTYDPVYERNELIEACYSVTDLKDTIIEFYKLKQAIKALSLPGDLSTIVEDSRRVRQQIQAYEQRFGRDTYFTVKVETLLKFRHAGKVESEFHLLSAFAAIKSLIGKSDFCVTTRSIIVMRMIGAKSNDALEESLINPVIKKVYDRYEKYYHFKNLMNDLLALNFICAKQPKKFAGKSRLCISCTLKSEQLDTLVKKRFSKK